VNENQVNSSIVTSRQTLPYSTTKPLSVFRYGVSLMDVSVSAVTNTVAYDSLGRRIVHTDGRGNTTHAEYNAVGQRSASINALGNRTTYAYDQFGNLASVTDPLGNATVYEYDLCGRKTYEGGATYPVRYTYDIFGNKTTMTTYRDETSRTGGSPVQGDVTTWFYDIASGSMTNKVYADGKGPKYDYTPDGKLAKRTWARGIVTEYTYDGWGNLTNTVYSDGTPTISLFYDSLGRQTEARDAAGVTTFLYDSFRSLTNETVIGIAGTNSIIRHWDEFGRTAGYTLNNVCQTTIGYEPDKGRIATMEIADNHSPTPTQNSNYFKWNYLSGSDLKSSLVYPNGLTASWTYDANNQLLQVCNATFTNVISQYDYTYDVAGRCIGVSKSGSAFVQNDSVDYDYNEKSELTNAVAAVDSNYSYAYDFDDIGNRESSSERGTNYVYAANQLNQYTAIDDFAPQFDDDGNQTLVKTSTGIWQVAYNGENRPVSWTCGSTNITMKFDRMGRRVEYVEMVNGNTNTHHRFVYDGYLCVQRLNGASNNAVELAFGWDPTEPVATRPLWMQRVFGTYNFFYFHDGNKNVSDLVSYQTARGVPAHYEYAPFGAVTAATTNTAFTAFNAAETNPYRFSSEYADDALGLVYYNYRHYEPVVGRWLSRDPKEIGLSNLYLFLQTPLFSFDHLGLETTSCCGPDVTLWALQEMMILKRWISQVRDMIHVWSEKEAPWYEPNFVREKSYSYVFLGILGLRLTYFPDTDFSQGASCATSQDCANTVTFHGRCVHSSEIGNFMYGFVARMFRMTWPQTLGGAICGNRGTRTTADSAAVEYGWDAADEGWWGDVKFPEDGSLAADMATDAPVQCKPSKCSTVVGHIALPPVTPTMNHTPINELKDSIVVPQTQR
jgi:RHS repeat-associated protein